MAESILKVHGIGPATATLLVAAGIKTADALAAQDVATVAAVKGFSDIRAARVIADANALLSAGESAAAAKPLEVGEKKTKKSTRPGEKKKSTVAKKAKKVKKAAGKITKVKPEKKKKSKPAKKKEEKKKTAEKKVEKSKKADKGKKKDKKTAKKKKLV